MEYSRTETGYWLLRVLQHQAARNAKPSPACAVAGSRLVAQLIAPEAREAVGRVEHARILRLHVQTEHWRALEARMRAGTTAIKAREVDRAAAAELFASRALDVLRRVRLLGAG